MEKECEKPTKKYPDGRTGTTAGYAAHKKEKETPCDACREGHKKYMNEYIRAKDERKCDVPTKKYPEGRRGTVAGYHCHIRAKETPCEDCREARHRESAEKNLLEKEAKREAIAQKYPLICEKPTAKYPSGRRGTMAGHRAHLRAGQVICEECAWGKRRSVREV